MYSEENLILQLAGMSAAPETESDGESTWPEGRPLASVYAPMQAWRELHDEPTALQRGTLFKELEFPFLGGAAHV